MCGAFWSANNHIITPANDTMLLIEKGGKGGYFRMELWETFRGIFDKFPKPHRVDVVGIYVTNHMAKFAEVIQYFPHFG